LVRFPKGPNPSIILGLSLLCLDPVELFYELGVGRLIVSKGRPGQ